METLSLLQNIWYILIGFLLIGYSILDGFDLGIGTLLPFLAKQEKEKRMLFNAIGPLWDGNEVWLITGAGALFAAFPHAYATVFSGFYLAFMLVLFALIFRAVSLEFWKYDEKRRKLWEWAFIIGSFLPSLLYGVALGNVVIGIPLDERMNFKGDFFSLLRPFPLVIGLLGFVAILMQGSTFAAMKTIGDPQRKARNIAKRLWYVFIGLFILSFILTLFYLSETIGDVFAWIASIVVLAAWGLMKHSFNKARDGVSFLMASLSFIGLWGIVGAIHFPNLVKANNNASWSLTIYNASSSELTLTVMLIIALIGMPIVLAYTGYVYRVFKGKVSPD